MLSVTFIFLFSRRKWNYSKFWVQPFLQRHNAFKIHLLYRTHHISSSFLFIPEYHCIIQIYLILFSYSLINEHLSTRLYVDMFSFPLDKYMRKKCAFKFLRTQQTFINDSTILHSHLQCMRVLNALDSHYHLILPVFFFFFNSSTLDINIGLLRWHSW